MIARHLRTFALFLIFCVSLVLSENKDTAFIKQHSFKQPFLMVKSGIAFWEIDGSTIISEESVDLTSNQQNMAGSIWNSWIYPYRNWIVQIEFSIQSIISKRGTGLAFWHTKEIGRSGPIFGGKSQWDGLGVFIDTNGATSIQTIFSVLNENKAYESVNDLKADSIGKCQVNLKSIKSKSSIRIRYVQNVLSILYFDSNIWKKCFDIWVDIPSDGYFGLSAATEESTQQHKVYSFIVNSVDTNEETNDTPIDEKDKNTHKINVKTSKIQIKDSNDNVLDQLEDTKVKSKKDSTNKVSVLKTRINQIETILSQHFQKVEISQRKMKELLKMISQIRDESSNSKGSNYEKLIATLKNELSSAKNSINQGLIEKIKTVSNDIEPLISKAAQSEKSINNAKRKIKSLEALASTNLELGISRQPYLGPWFYFILFEILFILGVLFWRKYQNISRDKLH